MQEEYVQNKLRALGKTIKELRMARNLTQMNVAQMAEVDSSNLQKIEAGKNTTVDTLVRICNALEIKEHLLFDYAWNKNKKAEFEKLLDAIRKRELSFVANSKQRDNMRGNYVTNVTAERSVKTKVARCELLLVRGGQSAIIKMNLKNKFKNTHNFKNCEVLKYDRKIQDARAQSKVYAYG